MNRARCSLLVAAFAMLASCGAALPGEQADQWVEPNSPPDIAPDVLRAVVTDGEVRRFYESRGWRPVWDPARRRTLLNWIERAPAHGLAPERFVAAKALPDDPAQREARLTRAALGFAGALANGVVDPARFHRIYGLPRARADVVSGLARAVAAGRLARWLAGLAPSGPDYQALSQAYLRYRDEACGRQLAKIPPGGILRAGDRDPRITAIRVALERLGYSAERGAGEPDALFSPALARMVIAMQEDFGLRRDGVVGPATLAVLNRGAAERVRQLAVNLERLRWLEREPPATRIDVNTGAAELVYWHGGEAVDRRRVAVGRPGWATPQLGAPIFRLVANPSWTVPRSIARAELAGKSARYLAARNMRRHGKWIVQRPGAGNALGRVKFDMRGRYAIYLHDTPARDVFDRSDRHLSHGCVRVADALGFARMLADRDGKRAAFEAALASGRERFVDLDRPVPVRLIYLTAYLDAGGTVRFRPDAYGWDDDVGRAMGLGRGRRSDAPAPAADVAP